MALSFRLFSVCPRVKKIDAKLVASTAWRLRILTLGSMYRKVTVDRDAEEVIIESRYLWLFPRRRRIRFQAIEAISYGYRDWSPGAYLAWAHDSADLFSVSLKLFSGDERHLFYFYGDGTFSNDGPLPDWLYWEDYLFDMSGTQERESKVFVELLGKMIKVPIVPG